MEHWGNLLLVFLVAFVCYTNAEEDTESETKLNKNEWTPKLLDPVKVGHEQQMSLFPFHKRKIKTISMNPPIFEIKNFLTDVECDHLISYAKSLGMDKSPLMKANETIDEETSERTFKIWDNNDDGIIEPVEIMHVRGKEDLFFTEEDILEMFKELEMDKDGNGNINYEEFSKVTVPVMKEYFDKVRRTKPRLRSRNSRQAWMFHNDPKYPILSDFHGRLSRLTLLPEEIIVNTEPLQVVKYDVHGHYHCHQDSDDLDLSIPCCTFSNEEDCRLCRPITVLFYLNEPQEGGETAFPLADNETYSAEAWTQRDGWRCNLAQNCHKSNLIVRPEKGKAIMWYNHHLDKSNGWMGDLDPMTQHGGCDVIKGTKWVANIWLTLVGDAGTGDAFKGWINHGKDDSKFKPGTNWKGENVKLDDEKREEEGTEKEVQNKQDENKEKETEENKTKDDEKEQEARLVREAVKEKDGSYDVKLEL